MQKDSLSKFERLSSSSSKSVHRENLHGVDLLWEAPKGVTKVDGILVLLHGCHHSATDFWDNTNNDACRGECLGLPEEKAIVEMGLERGMVVVALSSQNRKSKCWHPERDNEPVSKVLVELQQRWSKKSTSKSDANSLPLIAFGASSGGHVLSQLDTAVVAAGGRLDGIIAQIAPAPTGAGDKSCHCRVFITMNRDRRVDQSVTDAVKVLQQKTDYAVRHIRLDDLKIHDTFFTDRIGSDYYPPDVSKRMVEALEKFGLLDESTGKLIQDPRRSDWRQALQPLVQGAGKDSLQSDESPISEVLNVAYGKHEMTRDGVGEALDFCLPILQKQWAS
eukprot:scaffold2518_cov178-Amphora_coffeaeformis.AAC.5